MMKRDALLRETPANIPEPSTRKSPIREGDPEKSTRSSEVGSSERYLRGRKSDLPLGNEGFATDSQTPVEIPAEVCSRDLASSTRRQE